jgi:hypothetical protein
VNKTWRTIYKKIDDHLGKVFVRYVVLKVLGPALAGGFWGFIVARIAVWVWDKVGSEFVNFVKRKQLREMKRQETLSQLEDIREAENAEDFDSAVDNLN